MVIPTSAPTITIRGILLSAENSKNTEYMETIPNIMKSSCSLPFKYLVYRSLVLNLDKRFPIYNVIELNMFISV